MKSPTPHPLITSLSPHLFWDTEQANIDPEKNEQWIIARVLEYGFLGDWRLVVEYYGLNRIGETAKKIRDLDEKSLSFVSFLTGIPENEFLCYTTRQSNPKHWNF